MTAGRWRVRDLDPSHEDEVSLVAERMRETLVEVLGRERGASMYTIDWLVERVRWHLRPDACTGAVLLAEDDAREIVGHTIVRVDRDEQGEALGLVSTTFVVPERRRSGVAEALLRAGEAWLIARGMSVLATNTSETNAPLIRLYEKHGYRIVLRAAESKMVRMSRRV